MSDKDDSALYDAEYSDSDLDSDEEDEIGSSEGSEISDEEEEDTDEEEVEIVQASGVSSSEDNGDHESCPVCLNRFIGQDLGSPENCEHIFCLECIIEWSKNINTCPIDRTEFNFVHLKAKPGGKIIKKIKVKVRPKEPEDTLHEEETLCEICHLGDQPDRLLLCDGCDLAFHLQCLDPPLFHVPINEWYCPSCAPVIENGAIAGPSTSRYQRVIPRTRTSENVRVRVQNRRTQEGVRRSLSNATPRKPYKRKRRTYRRSIKKVVKLARTKKNLVETGKGKSCSTNTTVVVTYRRRRYRRRKKRKTDLKTTSNRKSHAQSAKDRISKCLGLVKPSSSVPVPTIKSKVKTSSRSVSSGLSYSCFGDRDQLMDFEENFQEDAPGPSNWKPKKKKEESVSLNLLETIMAGQKMLHTKSENVIIKTDGSLIIKEDKMKGKVAVKKPSTFDNSKSITNSKTCTNLENALKANESSKDCKVKEREVAKKLDKAKYDVPLEPASLGAIPKVQKEGSEKLSPMLLAALARRRENEKASMSVLSTRDRKRVSFSNENKYFELNYLSVEDNTQSQKNDQNSSFGHSKLQRHGFESETDDRKFLRNKKENDLINVNSNCSMNSKLNGNHFNSHDSHSFKAKQFFKNEQLCSVDEKYNEAGSGDFLKNGSAANIYPRIAISDDENCMDINSSQSLLQTNSIQSTSFLNSTKNLHINIKKENSSSAEESDMEASESLISPSKKQYENILSSSLFSSSMYNIKKSKTNIKEEPKLTKSEYSTNQFKNHPSVSKLNVQVINKDMQIMECSQNVIEPVTNGVSTQKTNVDGKCFKKELFSTNEKNSFIHSNSCSKYVNRSLDNQIRVKDELLSSDEERRDLPCIAKIPCINSKLKEPMCDITNDTPCTWLQETLLKKEVEEPCTQLAKQQSKGCINDLPCTQMTEHHYKEQNNSLPNILLAGYHFKHQQEDLVEHCSEEQKDNFTCVVMARHSSKEQQNDLPCTQLAEYRSKEQFDNLPCTQLAEHHSKEHQDSLPNTELAGHHSKEQQNHLPCTHLAEYCSEEQLDNLPCTLSVEHHSNDQKNSLPDTQLAEHRSKEQQDDFPCTQLAEYHFKEQLDNLPCTQLAEHRSKKQQDSLLCQEEQQDSLPCTQMAGHRSKEQQDNSSSAHLAEYCSKEEIDNLPCTQLAEHHFKEQQDDLPCTQLAEHCSKEQQDSLLCQEEQQDSLPCTQMAGHRSKEQQDNSSCAHLAEYCSKEKIDNLPCTQSVEHHSNDQKNSLPDTLLAEQQNYLPCTQLAEHRSKEQQDDFPCTQLAEYRFKEQLDNLPCTQLAEHRSKKQQDSLLCQEEQQDSLPCTEMAGHRSKEQQNNSSSAHMAEYCSKEEVDNLPCTQLAGHHSKEQQDYLPCTQLAEHRSKKQQDSSLCQEEQQDSLPCTQMAGHRSKEQQNNSSCAHLAEYCSKEEIDNFPCTQLTGHNSKEQQNDLPCTQLAEHCSKEQQDSLLCQDEQQDSLPCTQMAGHHSKEQQDNSSCAHLAEYCSKEKIDNLPCTQLAEHRSKEQLGNLRNRNLLCHEDHQDISPCTQFSKPSSEIELNKFSTQLIGHHLLGILEPPKSPQLAEHQSKQQMDDLPCSQVETLSHELLSEDKCDNLPTTQLAVPLHITHDKQNRNPINFASDSNIDLDLPKSQSLTLDDSHSKLLKFLKEKSNDENFTQEREQITALLLSSSNSEVKKSIKKMGSHRNLPQVVNHAFVRHIPVPKPTNKKTFSFDQVKQYYGLKDDKNTLNRSIVNQLNNFLSPCKSPGAIIEELSCAPTFVKQPIKCDTEVNGSNSKTGVKIDSEDEIEVICTNPESDKREKEIQEIVVSSDDEDFLATQPFDNPSNKILGNNLKEQNQKRCDSFSCVTIKQEQVMGCDLACDRIKNICNNVKSSCITLNGSTNYIIKKETDGRVLKEHHETLNDLNSLAFMKKEKEKDCCERSVNVLNECKGKSSMQLKSEKNVDRKIKQENKTDYLVESGDKCIIKEKYNSEAKFAKNFDISVRSDCSFVKNKRPGNNVEQNDNLNISRDKRKSETDHYSNKKYKMDKKIQIKSEDKSHSVSQTKKQDITKLKHIIMDNKTVKNKEKNVRKDSDIIKNKEEHVRKDSKTIENKIKHACINNKSVKSKDKQTFKNNNAVSQSSIENKCLRDGVFLTEKRKSCSLNESVVKNGSHSYIKRYKTERYEGSGRQEDNENKHMKKDIDRKLNNGSDIVTMKNIKNEFKKSFKNVCEENMTSNKVSSDIGPLNGYLNNKYSSKAMIPYLSKGERYQKFDNLTANFDLSEMDDHELINGSISNIKNVRNKKLLDSCTKNAERRSIEERKKTTFWESPSYSENTSDSCSSSMNSKILPKKLPKKFKHHMNALTALNQVADEIIASADKSKSHIFLEEPIEFCMIQKNSDSSKGRKVDRKYIKDEIAEEVKGALKPFYTSGLIDKEEYKDIMRKAVPKIYVNCGNYVNPEKIKSLVTNYVKKLGNS